MRCLFLSIVLSLTLATPAFATDGVLEINQTCAVNTGCFAGDSPGFPVTIDGSAGHGYRLTSDLTVPNNNTDGIAVSTRDVGIDLNSFAILGPVTCSGIPLTCTPGAGTGSGVRRTSGASQGISVKNGSITGMGASGVDLGEQAEVTNLRVRWSGLDGINVSVGSIVSGNTTYANGRSGINILVGATVSGNTAHGNGSSGISSGAGANISTNTTYGNGGNGIFASNGSTVSGNTTYGNGSFGISVASGSTVQRNTVRSNTGFGLNLAIRSTYGENTITSNTAGTVTGSGVSIGGNSCNGTSTCP
jgi:parallel beta-helix repeat protein